MASSIQLIWKHIFKMETFYLIWIPIQRMFQNQLETVFKKDGNIFYFKNVHLNQIMVSIFEIVSKPNGNLSFYKMYSQWSLIQNGYPQEVSIIAIIQQIGNISKMETFYLFWIPIQRKLRNQLETVSKQI